MLKKITEPLANYEKKPVAGAKPSAKTSQTKPAPNKKGLNWKSMNENRLRKTSRKARKDIRHFLNLPAMLF